MYKIGIQTPDDLGESLWTEVNAEAGMVAEFFATVDKLGYIAGISHDAVGLVTWYRVSDESQALAIIGLN